MKYDFETIIDRVNEKYSFSFKWRKPDYILNSLGIDKIRDDSICLETADMDFKVAPAIIEDLKGLCEHGIFGYSFITKEYREAVKSWYHRRQNWDFDIDDIYYLPGTHEAVSECVKRYTKVNDGVIVLTPCYGYHSDVDRNNRRYVCVDLINDGSEYYTIDYDALEEACKVENNTMLIMCHPHNPTGRVFTHDELVKVYDICRRHNVLIVTDEVHSDIIRNGVNFEPMMKACGDKGIISCTAVNKTFNLAGLAMTNVIIKDPSLKPQMESYNLLPSPFGVQAVISAYNKSEDWLNEYNKFTDELVNDSFEYIKKKLPKVKMWKPEGGYSINIDFTPYGLTGDEVTNRIYKKAGVILNSGLFFDDKRAKLVHRICLASPKKVIFEAIDRITKEFELRG